METEFRYRIHKTSAILSVLSQTKSTPNPIP
jgi:hypothetical protein